MAMMDVDGSCRIVGWLGRLAATTIQRPPYDNLKTVLDGGSGSYPPR